MVEVKLSAGSVRKWRSGFQARFRVYVTGEDGTKTKRQVYRSIDAGTMTEAKRRLAGVRQRLSDEISREYLIDDTYPGSSTVLGDYMSRYIAEREAAGAIEPTTAANYRNSAKHVMRHLPGDIRLDGVTAQKVRRMDAALLDDGLASDTVAKAHRFLKQVLAAAESEGLIERNPITRDVRPPKRERREADGLDEETRRRLLRIVDGMADTPLSLAVRMALATGMRNEECVGLRWRDVELYPGRGEDDAIWGTIHVRRCVTTAAGRVVEKGPKSAAGRRDIPLTADLAKAMLRRAREECGTMDTRAIGDLFVLGTRAGRPYNPTILIREFSSLARLYDVRCVSGKYATFYSLRHTAITAMLRAGVDAKTVSSLAGHSKVAETLDIYATTDENAKRHAAVVVASLMRQGYEDVAV